jgi:predicted chitinase
MKKMYILALTFFAVLCGQVSYGQIPQVDGEYSGISFGISLSIESVGTLSPSGTVPFFYQTSIPISINIPSYSSSGSQGGGGGSSYNYSSSNYFNNSDLCAIYGICPGSSNNYEYYYYYYDNNACLNCAGETAFTLSEWIIDLDGDTYFTDQTMSVNSPGAGWRQAYGSGFDCDDNNPNIRRDCYQTYYIDDDQDGYDQDDIYNVDDNGGYYKTSTLGHDCDDYDSNITTQCYNDYYQDKDGDGYHSATQKLYYTPAYHLGWKLGTSNGPDCDDNPTTGASVHKLNKCGKCEVEPVNGICGGNDCDTTIEDLKNTFGGNDIILEQVANAINKYAAKLGIDNKLELQHFLAQAALESNNFKSTQENTKYQTKSVMANFGKLFNDIGHNNENQNLKNLSDFGITTTSTGKIYIQNREALFNYIYSDLNRARVGYSPLGNTQTGDGFAFIGRGIIQITGRDNYTKFNNWYKENINPNVDLINNPTLLNTNKEIGTLASLWYFKKMVIDRLGGITDQTTVDQITKKVNVKMLEKEKRRKNFIVAKSKINCK